MELTLSPETLEYVQQALALLKYIAQVLTFLEIYVVLKMLFNFLSSIFNI